MKQFVGWGLVAAAALGIITFVFESEGPTAFTESLYTLAGLGFYGFGIWAAVLLLKK